jgi:hypothetical protein
MLQSPLGIWEQQEKEAAAEGIGRTQPVRSVVGRTAYPLSMPWDILGAGDIQQFDLKNPLILEATSSTKDPRGRIRPIVVAKIQ